MLKWKPVKVWFHGNYKDAQNVFAEVVGTYHDYDPSGFFSLKGTTSLNSEVTAPLALYSYVNNIALQYHVQERLPVTLTVLSLSGKNVATLVNSVKAAGRHYFN